MNIISLDRARHERAEKIATATADAERLVETSVAYGQMLAGDACAAIAAMPVDRELRLVVERFFLRRGLTRSRQSWRREYGRDHGSAFAKAAAPVVREAFWAKLDEINPLTCEVDGHAVPLIRGWRDASRRQSA